MDNPALERLKYPIGGFNVRQDYSSEYILKNIQEIESFPKRLKKEVTHLTNEQLETPD